jgi:hypothetical protein
VRIDEDYVTLANVLSSPIFKEVSRAQQGHTDTAVMVRLEVARQQLQAMRSVQPGLAEIRDAALRTMELCHSSMVELRRLNARVPDIEGIAGRAITATPGLYNLYNMKEGEKVEDKLTRDQQAAVADLIVKAGSEAIQGIANAYYAWSEKENYRKHYVDFRTSARNDLVKQMGVQYKSASDLRASAIAIDLDGSWNNTFNTDWLCLRNDSGGDLTRCTIFVSLNGTNAESGNNESDSHIHYMANWPAGTWIYAPYPSRAAGGIAQNESVDCVKSVKVWVYADQGRLCKDYSYLGPEYDKDVSRYVDTQLKPKFYGKWYNYTDHTFYDNGFEISYEGEFSSFPVSRVTVTIKEGSLEKSLYWNMQSGKMSSGWLGKLYLSDSSFNGRNPDTVAVSIEFPNSSYKHQMSWNLK